MDSIWSPMWKGKLSFSKPDYSRARPVSHLDWSSFQQAGGIGRRVGCPLDLEELEIPSSWPCFCFRQGCVCMCGWGYGTPGDDFRRELTLLGVGALLCSCHPQCLGWSEFPFPQAPLCYHRATACLSTLSKGLRALEELREKIFYITCERIKKRNQACL